MNRKFDFGGWATRNDLRCSDGRTIRKDAFKDNDGQVVPLVWNHQHNDPTNVLGHALLENKDSGVYAYCTFNDTETGQYAKMLVQHGDVRSLSIYANQLKQNGGDVIHGIIREVSLVLAGANPGASIDTVIRHGETFEEEAVIYTGDDIESLEHSDDEKEPAMKEEAKPEEAPKEEAPKEEAPKEEPVIEHKEAEEMADNNEKTVGDVLDSLTEEQKAVVYALIGEALNNEENTEDEEDMKQNVFDSDVKNEGNYLTHSEEAAIFADAKRYGSLKESALQHGITNIDLLFPDAQAIDKTPDWVSRESEWVRVVMNGVHHTPFARVKSLYADITADDARAKGFVPPNAKVEEVFPLYKRETPPQTIYKKQKMNRDDLIDITDFDVVAWLKAEMRAMLDEEIARAILVGDGRDPSSDDKILEERIRPVWTDNVAYAVHQVVDVAADGTPEQKAKAFIRAAVKSRKNYRGSGNPILFTTEDILTDCLLMEDNNGRVIYDTVDKLCNALRVSKVVTVPVMENKTRTATEDGVSYTYGLMGMYLNLNDYNVGADKGGAVSMFDDFDIDYNAQKYLIETRCSGALVHPLSAVVLETKVASA